MTQAKFTYQSAEIPTSSGCYLFWDQEDHLLYVGKAKHLRKRVSSYFQKTNQSAKTALMVSKIARIETRTVNTEIEALILENNLVKEYRPRFNVLLRDDKNFLYLRVTNQAEPKLEIVRKVVKDGSTYFGPKTSSRDFRDTIKFCQKFFGAKMVKPGQDYYINQITGHQVSAEEYRANIERMKRFLRGQTDEIVKEIKEKMMTFAAEQKFEAAAKLRDTLESIQKSTQKQTVEFTDKIDRDFINFHRDGKSIYVVRLAFRQGRLRDVNHLKFSGDELNQDSAVIEQFLTQFYEKVTDYPREIFIPTSVETPSALENFLSTNYFENQVVELIVPQKGDKRRVLEMAAKNAKHQAEKATIEAYAQAENFAKALPELAQVLELKSPPKRIECFDVSHFSGTHTVASMVVFVDGKPKTSEYRRFKIKTLPNGKIDDFASMEEVLKRRFGRSTKIQNVECSMKNDGRNTQTPSLPGGGIEGGEVLKMKPVETEAEWEVYHHINAQELYLPHDGPDFKYDPHHPDLTKTGHHPMVFILNGQVVGIVRLDHKSKTRLIMRTFGFEKTYQRKGYGTLALELIEAHAIQKNFKSVVLNAVPSAIKFYEKNGYTLNFWKGDAKNCDCQPMGKKLTAKKEKWALPDLMVIDGGKGQLSSVMKAFSSLPFEKGDLEGFCPETQIIALAKREEQIFRPGKPDPIELDFDSSALKLLQRLRDEAHRFAISFNRSLRAGAQTKSVLDEVAGIGTATKKKLLQQFENVSGIREASDEALLQILKPTQLESLRRQL